MYERYQVMTAGEAAVLWKLDDSTLRKAISENRLQAQKSKGTWLVTTEDMRSVYGEPKPDASFPTLGETFCIRTDAIPLIDIGRVPGAEGKHVLTTPSGDIITIGGYWLRRENEEWIDVAE